MCSTTASRLGLIAPSSTALSSVNHPSTTSVSGKLQPATLCRDPEKAIPSGTSARSDQNAETTPCTRKSTWYCIATVVEARTWIHRSLR
jgi:hypothetical protein